MSQTGQGPHSAWSELVRGLASMAESERTAAVEAVAAAAGDSVLSRVMLQSVAERDASPAVRRAALDALRRAGGPVEDGPSFLGRELANKSAIVRERAAWVACVLRSTDLAFTLRQRLRAEPEPRVRVALLGALAAVGGASDLMVAAPFLEAPEPAVRAAALRTASMLAGADASPYVVRGLTDASEDVRSLAMGILANRGWPAIRALLAQMASSSIAWHVECAAVVLGGTKSADAVELLAPLRTHSLDSVRSRARRALAQLARAGIDGASRLLEDEQSPASYTDTAVIRLSRLAEAVAPTAATTDTRAWAKGLLAEGRAERWNELARRLDEERDPAVAAFLVSCLGRLGAKAAVPSLLPFAAHPEARVRANAVEALRLLARADQLDALLPCLEDTDNRVRANALVALAAHPSVDVPARLAAMAASPREDMQLSALYVAEMLASPQAVTSIADLARSPHATVREKLASPALSQLLSRSASRRPSAFLWGGLAVAALALAAAPLSQTRVDDSARSSYVQPQSGAAITRPWEPALPAPRAPGTPQAERDTTPLSLPERLVAGLRSTAGVATTLESFDARWRLLYELLFLLPEELRAEIATLADLTLLRGALRTRPQESCDRLEEWLELTRQLVLPRLARPPAH
ncbi:MAG: HEAT repeat domain-containing protein [Candidatus Wallbacteria bacterium]|nr:HEAT repeat domain-containing protein [Candidatus Wallbacteria bacterium]